MRQFTQREFVKILNSNGFYCARHSGGHSIYTNENGIHISIPKTLKSVIALRLIKQYNLL